MHYILTRSRLSILLILLFALTTAALSDCNHRKSKKVDPTKELEVFMQKNTCYGKCPSYELRINESGMALLESKKHMPQIGMFEKELTQAQMQELYSLIEQSDFFNLNDMYMMKIPDLPATVISVKQAKAEKQVVFDMDYPEGLKSLEDFLKSIGEDPDGWSAIKD